MNWYFLFLFFLYLFIKRINLRLKARRQPLPRNGPEWAEIRDGVLHLPGHFSPEFCQLLLVCFLQKILLSRFQIMRQSI